MARQSALRAGRRQGHFDDLCELLGVDKPRDPDNYCFERGAGKASGGDGWADVWKRGCFGWENKRAGRDLRAALVGLSRYIATPSVAKHRLFAWMDARILADHQLIVVARTDDATFGILHSRFHELWSLRLGTSLEDRPHYTPTTTFETFPFPAGLTPRDTAPVAGQPSPPCMAPQIPAANIAAAARRLNELRDNWLNPPEWTERIPEVVPGYPERIVAKPGHEAELKKRTLPTSTTPARPGWPMPTRRSTPPWPPPTAGPTTRRPCPTRKSCAGFLL